MTRPLLAMLADDDGEAVLAQAKCECPVMLLLCPPYHSQICDPLPLSCPAPTISTPRSRRQRAQKLGRKDQRALVPKLPISISPCSTRKAQESLGQRFSFASFLLNSKTFSA